MSGQTEKGALQPAYILHSRPYRDSSTIVEILTAQQGRLSLVARGARRRSRRGSSAGAELQLFCPLLVSFSGRSELKTVRAVEPAGPPVVLRAERLYSGMYLNELTVRLLHRHDPHPRLFAAYSDALFALAGEEDIDAILRNFELTLLEELGYGLDLSKEGGSSESLRADQWYCFHDDRGLVPCASPPAGEAAVFSGADLLLMSEGQWSDPVRLPARRLLRLALATHLGGEPLRSRELFRARYKNPPGVGGQGEKK